MLTEKVEATRIHHAVARHGVARPDAIALVDYDGRKFNYAALNIAIEKAALVLKEQGVGAGDRVLMIAENCVAAVSFIYAASTLGAWAVPVNARMTEAELRRIKEHATPRVTLCTTAASKEARDHAERMGGKTVSDCFGEVVIATEFNSDPVLAVDSADQGAVILYTTGTTGAPKGVMLSHGNLIFAGHASATLRELTPADTLYGVLPVSHVFGLASIAIAGLYAGATVILRNGFKADLLYQALHDGVTVFPAVPQMHALLMEYTHGQGYTHLRENKLRYVSSGGAPLDPTWKREAEAFYGIALQNGYGMTEATAGVCSTANILGDEDISVGHALPGVEVKLNANNAADKNLGEILIRGSNIMQGYYQNQAQTDAVLCKEGWLSTGDLGQFDEKGRLHIVGRSKELIIRSGFNVFPLEIEAVLNEHPQVVQSAVIGRSVQGNEEVLAFIQVSEGVEVTEGEIKDFVKRHLVSYKCPSKVVVTNQLPIAATGKVLKHRLLEVFEQELDFG